ILVMSAITLLSWSVSLLPEEERLAAPLPKLKWDQNSLAALPSSFEKFFNDRLAFRIQLVRWRNYLKMRLFVISPTPAVVVGKDGWLFCEAHFDSNTSRERVPMTSTELASWKEVFEQRAHYLADKGIRYLVVVAPEKAQIYPEFLPERLRLRGRPARMDQ